MVPIKTTKQRVPQYRFHHVGIKKNILAPNTMLTFVPHLRDLEGSEEATYNLWMQELEDIDRKSGFKPMAREDRHALICHLERATTISLYLETWLEDLAIPGCNKSTLISYIASQEPDDSMTPQQKSEILRLQRDAEKATPEQREAAKMFTDAFRQVFWDGRPAKGRVELRKVLLLHESLDGIMDSKPTAKDGAGTLNEDEDEVAESYLATYCILGCLICFSHSCDHGEYDNRNWKRTFAASSCSRLSDALKRRRMRSPRDDGSAAAVAPCHRLCYREESAQLTSPRVPSSESAARPWSEDERLVLRSIYTTASHGAFDGDAICLVAEFLDRDCVEVQAEFLSMGISLPPAGPTDEGDVRTVPWYDRWKKVLLGDWQEHTLSHEHQRRETLEPCSHQGPCVPQMCPCVDAGLLCERFCGCTVDSCGYKFTGCACHSQGKTCHQRQKDRPCICVQLNRECDPQLCDSCGALERADAQRSGDEELHATGCQNCDLQRGVGKAVLLGQSQLEGVGYGLFTAEFIAQDDFVIEYVGELISHDEGVRREARRGDVFNEESNISYVFTLLENEGIWVDAAIYGNLSRYINHASENDKRGCNITPRILYVNGEFRIKFTAMRDIQAGEELFFNYGENFPNLTKKLLDNKAGRQTATAPKTKGARSRRPEARDQVARKEPTAEQMESPGRGGRRGGARGGRRGRRGGFAAYELKEPGPAQGAGTRSRKRKRRLDDDDDDKDDDGIDKDDDDGGVEEEYRPAVTVAAAAAEETGHERVVGGAESMTRLRKRRRQQGETSRQLEQPAKKTKGKRGGARPGSGRPRKHPRPVPKSAGSGSSGTGTGTGQGAATQQARAKTKAGAEERGESSRGEEVVTVASEATTERAPGRATAGERQPEGDEAELEVTVAVRQRNERAARKRRPPVKFGDDGAWG